ncbi:ATP-dependent zinc metalloprotease FtsH [Clostridium perfringens]|uniref:ATP-dependent zinc metalloprotease FtsH n=2 Tax=Clostridium perfringens TaxID=1502 RepID=A0A2X2Y7X9_CLOPF|nr:ATP-dependent zinc metalloprotease FtsH [Clostridium perfringens]AXH53664.1 ATP-dependent metallopeptidase FtsH/Yme1/Tma family protein [Clostridium perfringens]EDS80795.1 ATP-dependent metalloprotease FtsH [Clostridium perfringens C str. JGS1495]ELC8420945.1 ATP-dependent zinc metalloprotease FtsH [Clostridium perfringens]MBI6028199.1 ATP-dependent metallopeptidase FtsH/Yme1/Tma family protein [Clostridium perfringens]MBI6031505.1 ATP-dependent metallopeptidase FtsH/Yme1/Tma family protein
MKKLQSMITYIAIFAVVLMFAFAFYRNGTQGKVISYTEFKEAYVENKIETMTIKEDKMSVDGVLKDGKRFTSYVSNKMLDNLLQETQGVETVIKYTPPNNMGIWISFLPTILIIGVIFFGLFMFTQQAQNNGGNRGVMNFGKSKAKMANLDGKKVTFKDVAGADEEKGELEEIVDFLKQPKRYIEMGARIPKGVLLVGPPGTGKTLLAKAIAGEAGVPFFSISGSDFVEMFVGVGASRVRDLFEQAKKNAPCIIFIDEIDAVGRQRGAGLGGGHDEREQTLNQLLVEMDGFGVNEGIIMIAATNRPDILDPALLRPGRFDRRILVGAPDVKGREEVLKVHTRNKHLSEDVDLKVLAKMTPGFSGADLENLTNEAALLAVRGGKSSIDMADIEEAITRVIAGPEKKSRVVSEYDRRITAVHESGHAVVSNVLEYADPVHEISIIQRGMAAGYTMNLPEEDRTHTSKKQLKDKMVELLGGRVAEKLVIGDISAGAKNDIDRASHIARSMVMEYGMSDVIGPISFGNSDGGEVFLGRDIGKSSNISEETSAKIDEEIKKLIDEAYNRAESILRENISKLNAVTDVLLQKEKIDGDEFREIFKNS